MATAREVAVEFVRMLDVDTLTTACRKNSVGDAIATRRRVLEARVGQFSARTEVQAVELISIAYAAHDDVDEFMAAVDPEHVHCDCGEITGTRCEWRGPRSETMELDYMPANLRDSHERAGNRGLYPGNGALRVRCQRRCAAGIVESSEGWAEIVGSRANQS